MIQTIKPTYEELAQALMYRDCIWIAALQAAVVTIQLTLVLLSPLKLFHS